MPFGTRMPSLRTHLRWIEDFALWCRLVPVCAPHTRFLFVIPYLRGTLPRKAASFRGIVTDTPVAIPLRPFASIRLGLRLAKCLEIRCICSLLRTCAVPGTPRRLQPTQKAARLKRDVGLLLMGYQIESRQKEKILNNLSCDK